MTTKSSSVLDRDALLERCLGNLEFVERVLARFQERAEQDLEELEKVVELHDVEQVARIAHRIKGSSANVSAEGLQQEAGKIEELGRSGHLADIPAHLERLRREWQRYLQCSASLPLTPDTDYALR
jgi:HPt (histidine-containing phosphotransfer) domain-containing protein